MRRITTRLKPASGFSHFVHIGLTSLLPALIFAFVRIGFAQLAVALILLGKWRMFAVKPRHWPANIRANGIDIIVGLSTVVFMTHSGSQLFQLLWAVLYGIWLLALKPQSALLGVGLQALVGEVAGLTALFMNWGASPAYVLVIGSWAIAYVAARHFFAGFDEVYGRFLSNLWAYSAAALVWILSHWLLFYGVIAQPTLLLGVISFGLAGIYYLEKTDRLTILLRRQLVFVMIAIVVIVLTFSDWGDKAI